MQVSFYIIVGFSMNFSIRGWSAWARTRIVRVTALDIQISLRNPTAMLEDSMTSVKTLYIHLACIAILSLRINVEASFSVF